MDTAATPESVYRDEIEALCGGSCVADMLILFRESWDSGDLHARMARAAFSYPCAGHDHESMATAAARQRVGARWAGTTKAALQAARRARLRSTPRGQAYLDYWIGCLKFGIGYFDTVQLVRMAARRFCRRRHRGPKLAEAALFEARTALEDYADVARDQSDRGAIAVMDEYVYRALKNKVSELSNGGASPSQAETSLRPSITVVKNGESAVPPEKCQATLIGPGVNQPDPFPRLRRICGLELPGASQEWRLADWIQRRLLARVAADAAALLA